MTTHYTVVIRQKSSLVSGSRLGKILLLTRQYSRMCIRTYFFCFKKKHKNTKTHTQNANVTEEEKRKTKETKEEKEKDNVPVVNSICGKQNGIR